MPGEVGEHSDCLDLNLLVLSGEKEVLDAVEDRASEVWCEQRLLGRVVVEDIGDAAHGIEHELLIFLNSSSIHSVAELLDKLVEQVSDLVELFVSD